MIYIKNTTETQTIFIPRNELQKEAYITSTKTYEDGYREGLEDGKEQQKNQLLNLYVTENGQYEREDGWGTVTVDIPIGECPDCPEGGTCNLGVGEIVLTPNDAGFYELYASDDGYDGWSKFIVDLEGGAIKVHKAEELIQMFNEGWGIDFGRYYYVGGKITEIQEVNTQYGNATYVLDNGFKVYRGDWIDGNPFGSEDQIKVGAYIVVYGIIQDYNGQLQLKAHSQVIAYKECEGDTPSPEPIQSGWGLVGYFNEWGGTPDIPFEGDDLYWNNIRYQYIKEFNASGGEFKIRLDNTWDNSYTANLYNEPQFALLQKGDWNMELFDGVWDIYLFYGGDGMPSEILILEAGIDINTISYEYGLVINTNTPDAVIAVQSDYDGSYQEYYGGSAWIPMKYGNSYGITVCANGYECVYDYILCYSNEERYYELVEAPNQPEPSGCNLINPIIFSESEGNTINAESVEIPTFVYEGNHYYNIWPLNMAEYDEFKIQIKFQPINGGYDEPVNIFGCEDTDWDSTTFGARIYMGNIYFRMSGQDIAYLYSDYAWYDVEMGYNSSKRWITVNGETILEADHAWFTKPSQNFMIGAINSGGNAFRPFYGKIATTYIEANGSRVWLLPKEDGHMDVYWNDESSPWVSLSGENNARFEIDWMGGDGMKTITWLGKRVSCNFEDKGVTPSMSDRDGNGLIVVEESEGFDGLSRVVIDPTTIYNEGYTDGYNKGSNQLSNNVLEGDTIISFQLNDNNFPDLCNDGKGIFMWDGFQVPLYIKRPNGCGELYLTGNYDIDGLPSLHSKFFQDDDYAKIEKLTINLYHIIPNNIVNVVNLKELHLTEKVNFIDKNAFQGVSNLKTIYCYYDNEEVYMGVDKDAFVGLPNNGTLYVKKSAQPTWMWIRDLGWTIVNI